MGMQDFEKMVKKFHVGKEELGEAWNIFRRAEAKGYTGSRLEGYFGLGWRNLRIDRFKEYVERAVKFSHPDNFDSLLIYYSDVEDKIFIEERIGKFKVTFPSFSAYIDKWKKGEEVSDTMLLVLAEKFYQIPV